MLQILSPDDIALPGDMAQGIDITYCVKSINCAESHFDLGMREMAENRRAGENGVNRFSGSGSLQGKQGEDFRAHHAVASSPIRSPWIDTHLSG